MNQDEIGQQHRKAEMVKLADFFEAAVGEIVETVSSASTELEVFRRHVDLYRGTCAAG